MLRKGQSNNNGRALLFILFLSPRQSGRPILYFLSICYFFFLFLTTSHQSANSQWTHLRFCPGRRTSLPRRKRQPNSALSLSLLLSSNRSSLKSSKPGPCRNVVTGALKLSSPGSQCRLMAGLERWARLSRWEPPRRIFPPLSLSSAFVAPMRVWFVLIFQRWARVPGRFPACISSPNTVTWFDRERETSLPT